MSISLPKRDIKKEPRWKRKAPPMIINNIDERNFMEIFYELSGRPR